MAAYIPLLNHKLDRSTLYYETIKIPAGGVYKLKYIPREDGFIVTGYTLAPSNSPTSLQYWIDFREDYDYWGCNRELYFNLADVGSTVNISYYPVGSNVDADDLNPILNWYNDNIMDVAYKSKLKTNGQAEVHWGNLTNVPPLADDVRWGFMSSQCYIKSMFVDESKYPLGGFTLNGTDILLKAWGDRHGIKDTQTIKVTTDIDGSFLFNVDVLNTPGIVGEHVLEALAGTNGSPSASNKFVTENDPRFISPIVIAHTHSVNDINNLLTLIAGKAAATHGHGIAEVTGLQDALDGKSATGHKHEISDTDGLQAALDGKSATGHIHSDLQTQINGKASTRHTHASTEVLDLTSTVSALVSSMAPNPTIYGLQKETTNVNAIIQDYTISGLTSSIGGPTPFSVTITAGSQYAGGVRIAYPGGVVSTLGPTIVHRGSTPITRYPRVSGTYTQTIAQSWTITVTSANTMAGSMNGLVLTVHDNTTTGTDIVYTQTASVLTPLPLGYGLTFIPYSDGSTTQYVVGDSWNVDINLSGYCYGFLTSTGTVYTLVHVADDLAITPPNCSPIFKAQIGATGIASLVDMRVTSLSLSTPMKAVVSAPVKATNGTLNNTTAYTVSIGSAFTNYWLQLTSNFTGTFTYPPTVWLTKSGTDVIVNCSSNTVSVSFTVYTS